MPRAETQSTDQYLTIKAAAELLGVAPNTLRSWGAAGKVSEYRHPVNNYRLYEQSELDQLLAKLRRPVKVVPRKKAPK